MNSSGQLSLGGSTAGQSIELALYAGGASGFYNSSGTAKITMSDKPLQLMAGNTTTSAAQSYSLGTFYGKSYPVVFSFTSTNTITVSHTVPFNYTSMIIEVWGAGGSGSGTGSVSGEAAGNTGTYSSVSGSGLTTMTANGGFGGSPAVAVPCGVGGSTATNVAGGTASGGNTTNTTGNIGKGQALGNGGGNGITGTIAGGTGGAANSNGSGSNGGFGAGGGGGGSPGGQIGGGCMAMCYWPSEGGGGGGGGYCKTVTSSLATGTVLTIRVAGTTANPSSGSTGGYGQVLITYY